MKWEDLFSYPSEPHVRSHWPKGYSDYKSMKPWLRDEFSFRCVYCLEREEFGSDGAHRFAVEHVDPKSAAHSRRNDYTNLVYACTRCNTLKGTHVIPCPIELRMSEVLFCLPNGEFESLTPDGEELIEILQLNDPRRIKHRFMFLSICRRASEPEADAEVLKMAIGLRQFPEDLPDLRKLNRAENAKPDSEKDCYFVKREEGRLPAWY